MAVALAVALVVAVAAFRGGLPGGLGSLLPLLAAPGGQPVATADGAGFHVLSGRWLRPDGGYILDIRGVGANGTIDAAYLNPRPINVARAEAKREGSTLKVFVELRAPGYPGSTYTLTYDATRDRLEGIYFQATMRENFHVVFVRVK
ncbi:MAG TPA: hypothetical protein VED18_16810 [Candidatus Sulfotelmatobacter sp.]|nr:hypothetical protein [Candidatus Sulfotelmatobacter sp.]